MKNTFLTIIKLHASKYFRLFLILCVKVKYFFIKLFYNIKYFFFILQLCFKYIKTMAIFKVFKKFFKDFFILFYFAFQSVIFFFIIFYFIYFLAKVFDLTDIMFSKITVYTKYNCNIQTNNAYQSSQRNIKDSFAHSDKIVINDSILDNQNSKINNSWRSM